MKVDRIKPTPVPFVPITITLETPHEAIVMKYFTHYLCLPELASALPEPIHFSRESAARFMDDLWHKLGALGIDYNDGKA